MVIMKNMISWRTRSRSGVRLTSTPSVEALAMGSPIENAEWRRENEEPRSFCILHFCILPFLNGRAGGPAFAGGRRRGLLRVVVHLRQEVVGEVAGVHGDDRQPA